MQGLEKLEDMIAGWMKDVPHLPKEFTHWLATNSWWLTIIGVVFGAFALFGALSILTVGAAFVGAVAGAGVAGMLFVSTLVSLAVTAATIVIEAIAISPLKAMKKRGWDLLFLAALVSFVGGVVTSLLSGNFSGAIIDVIAIAIACYVLLEVKQYFTAVHVEAKSHPANRAI